MLLATDWRLRPALCPCAAAASLRALRRALAPICAPTCSLVIDAIKDLDADRKCFRMIGEVLVERTVGEVLPAITKNRDGVRLFAPAAPHPACAALTSPRRLSPAAHSCRKSWTT